MSACLGYFDCAKEAKAKKIGEAVELFYFLPY